MRTQLITFRTVLIGVIAYGDGHPCRIPPKAISEPKSTIRVTDQRRTSRTHGAVGGYRFNPR